MTPIQELLLKIKIIALEKEVAALRTDFNLLRQAISLLAYERMETEPEFGDALVQLGIVRWMTTTNQPLPEQTDRPTSD